MFNYHGGNEQSNCAANHVSSKKKTKNKKRCGEGESLQEGVQIHKGDTQWLPVQQRDWYTLLWRSLQYFHHVRAHSCCLHLTNNPEGAETSSWSAPRLVSRYSQMASTMVHSCSCCKEVRFTSRTVNLRCINGEVVPFTYTHVEECGCAQADCGAPSPARRRRSLTLVWRKRLWTQRQL